MRPTAHLMSGLITGGITYMITKDITCAAVCAAGNVVSDTDHLLEYGHYCLKYREKPTVSEFLSGEYFSKKQTIGVVFHAYEYLLLLVTLCALAITMKWFEATWLVAFTVGYGIHLLLDTIGNECTVRGYCILYRIYIHFNEGKICGRK